MQWFALQNEFPLLAVAPMFPCDGHAGGLNGPVLSGNTMVLLPRWDREVAALVRESATRSRAGPPSQR